MAAADHRPAAPPRESRHRAREAAVQMLYQWEVGRRPVAETAMMFWLLAADEAGEVSEEERAFATRLAEGVTASLEAIDPLIVEAAEHWRLERMNALDRLILRLAVYEFLHEPETPARVVINEALELARTFSGEDAVGFINGLLDAVRRRLGRT
jgi:N utilization substance protein B